MIQSYDYKKKHYQNPNQADIDSMNKQIEAGLF